MRINFTHFLEGLDALRIRITSEDAKAVFNHLDTKKYSYLTMDQFIELYDFKSGKYTEE